MNDYDSQIQGVRDAALATIDYCDDLLSRYDAWQRAHPAGVPCDLETLTVARAKASRVLAMLAAGEAIPDGTMGAIGEMIRQFDLTALLYRTDNLGDGGIKRSPESDRRFGMRPG